MKNKKNDNNYIIINESTGLSYIVHQKIELNRSIHHLCEAYQCPIAQQNLREKLKKFTLNLLQIRIRNLSSRAH